MSIRHINAAWSAPVSDSQAKIVLLKLADCADKDGLCWPSLAVIAADTCLHRSTVYRKIEALEAAGLITRNRLKNGCEYTVIIDSNQSHTATGSNSEPVASCDQLNSSTSRTEQPVAQSDQSQSATQLVAHSDTTSRTVRLTYTREPSGTTIEPPLKSARGGERQQQALTITSAYPRREKIALALSIVLKDLNDGESFDEILASTKAIAAVIRSLPSGASNRYVPSAETFFRDKRWQDDPETFRRDAIPQPVGKGQTATSAANYGI